ncbi:LysE family translocator [Nocardioides sp. YIM 152588]|uniref:LysE family translocator n=1 Tax=Nocardioides sp. YIM 152588 TaxID=3158259 RepID=UPI0032E5040C
MVGADQLLGFGLAALVVIVIPGPSVVFTVGRALAYGQRVAVATVAGNTLGLFVVMCLVSVGLGAVVARSQAVFTTIKLLGAAYLVWLGVQALRHRRALRVSAEADGPVLGWGTAVRQGFVVGVSNPKGFLLFAALLPPFVDRAAEAAPVPAQMLALGLFAVLVGLVCDSAWALAAGRAREWFARSPGRSAGLGTVGGTSMIGLGVALALLPER